MNNMLNMIVRNGNFKVDVEAYTVLTSSKVGHPEIKAPKEEEVAVEKDEEFKVSPCSEKDHFFAGKDSRHDTLNKPAAVLSLTGEPDQYF